MTDRRCHHSTNLYSESLSCLLAPIYVELENASKALGRKNESPFDHVVRTTQQQLEDMQRQTLQQSQARRYQISDHQQHYTNMFIPILPHLTTPALIVNYPPVIRTTTVDVHRKEAHQLLHKPEYVYSSYA